MPSSGMAATGLHATSTSTSLTARCCLTRLMAAPAASTILSRCCFMAGWLSRMCTDMLTRDPYRAKSRTPAQDDTFLNLATWGWDQAARTAGGSTRVAQTPGSGRALGYSDPAWLSFLSPPMDPGNQESKQARYETRSPVCQVKPETE